MGFNLKMKLEGVKELEKQLKRLRDPKTAKKIQRSAATAAIKPMRKAVKSECPISEGGLEKSVDSKVSLKGENISAIVGSNTAVLETGEKAKEKDEGPRAARHLHLVLFGHVTESGTAVHGNNFMQRGYEKSIAESQRKYEEKLKDGLEKAVDAK